MSGLLSSWLTRLLVGGVICFACAALAGKGGLGEPVRLGCACLMIALLLRPPGGGIDLTAILDAVRDAERTVSMAAEQGESETRKRIAARTGELLTDRLGMEGVSLSLLCDEAMNVIGVAVRGEVSDREAVTRRIAELTGLPPQQIVFEG